MTRAKGKSHWKKFRDGVLVLCKCPFCGEKHLVKFESAPSVMLILFIHGGVGVTHTSP